MYFNGYYTRIDYFKMDEVSRMTSGEYQNMLKDQIKQAGLWLIKHADDIVSDVKNISDFKITIDLENGCKLPTIKFMQENCFWNYDEWEKRKEIVGEK